MIKVAVTGGIGSGKTTVCEVFKQLGIPVFNADEAAKQLMHTDKKIISGIKKLLGNESYSAKGILERALVAQKIFNNPSLLKQMNALVHPAVREAFQKWAKQQMAPYVIQEVAILFENHQETSFDFIIAVTAPLEVKLKRVMERDQVDRQKVMERMKNQLPDEYKTEKSHFVIVNDGDTLLLPQIIKIHQKLR
ncbi:dephospho-CoA kinase [Roseimarinus sediminis]|jgi:dephospho-CoA kinase|uniref:dephospho-CoA kinase n=1 Tax=Roseimarinus sediminis TaxID=1610899 RepID=UPI003D1B258F